MEFIQDVEPKLEKPIIIAAMQDMGNIGSIVVEHINANLQTKSFRTARTSYPSYVLDIGGYIEIPNERWEYKYKNDLIIFGGSSSQPQSTREIHSLCQDVIDIAKKYSAKFIYTVGGFHTNRKITEMPKTFVTTTSVQLKNNIEKIGLDLTPQKSIITGFNGVILGYAKQNGIQGMGLYAEINEPTIPQYRSAKSIIKTLEKLTFQKFGETENLDIMADKIDKEIQDRGLPEYR